jgi:hypothetical protein
MGAITSNGQLQNSQLPLRERTLLNNDTKKFVNSFVNISPELLNMH